MSKFSKLKQDDKFITLMETVGKELSKEFKDEKQDDVEAQSRLYELIAKTNEALRIISGALYCTRTEALDFEAGVEPLELVCSFASKEDFLETAPSSLTNGH